MTATVTSEAIVPVAPYQQVSDGDLTAMSSLNQGSIDNVVANVLIGGVGYTGMSAAQVGTTNIVAIQPGYLIKGGPAYSLRDPFNVDVSAAIASIPDSAKTAIVAIVADGQAFPSQETRTFVDASRLPTDPTSAAPTVTQATPVRIVREVVISSPAGTPDVIPSLPAFSSTLCLIATVIVTNTGIVSVTQQAGTQITRYDQALIIISALEGFQKTITPIISQLQSSVSALATSVNQRFGAIQAELAADEARINALESRLSAPTSIFRDADYFIDLSKTDTTATSDSYSISQGLNFPTAGVNDQPLVPQNIYAANVKTLQGGRYIMPAYTEVFGAYSQAMTPGSEVITGGNVYFIGSIQWNTFNTHAATLLLRGFAVWRVRWANVLAQLSTSQLLLNGDPNVLFAITPADLNYNAALWGDWRNANTELIRLTGFWRDCAARGFWTPVLAQPSVSLPVIGQGYTPSGDQMVTAVSLGIAAVGGGNVRMLMVGSVNGYPDVSNMLADVTFSAGAQGSYSSGVALPYPVLVKGGTTVFFLFYTSGPHYLRTLTLGQGALNGPAVVWGQNVWQVLSGVVEIAMGVTVAQFTGGATRIPVQALTLAGGIDQVDIAVSSIVPTGCSIDYEGQIGTTFVPIAAVTTGPHPLAGRPTNLPLNIIMSGTKSIAPIIDLQGAKARVSGQGGSLQHTSIAETPSSTVHTVNMSITIANYNSNLHTITSQLLTGTGFSVSTPPASTPIDSVQSDGTLLRQFTWAISGGASAFKLKILGNSTDTSKVPTIRQANWDAEV